MDKLEYSDGRSWEEVHSVDYIYGIARDLVKDRCELSEYRMKEFLFQLDQALEGLDSYDTVYLAGYMRHYSFYIETFSDMGEAVSFLEYGLDSGYLSPEFVINPYKKAIWID